MSTTSPPTHPVDRGPGPSAPTVSTVRASDAERAEVVDALQHALGEGRLDLADTEERVAAAYCARYRSDLLPLVADLPDAAASALPTRSVPSWTAIWRALVWRARLLVSSEGASAAPTARQCRTAALLATAAVLWFLLCALVGAAAVGA